MLKIYKVKDNKDRFWTGRYKKVDEKGKAWCYLEDVTIALSRIKNIPKDWKVIEFEILPVDYKEYDIPEFIIEEDKNEKDM
jgi:hypothetical protein